MASHADKKNGQKKVKNPEAALQASVARDIKLRLLDEHAKGQADALAVAKWEVALGQKDVDAAKKRSESENKYDSQLTNKNVKRNRKERLQLLFEADEIKYEAELAAMGLSFRRDRV